MVEVTHDDKRVEIAFNARRDAELGRAEWHTAQTVNYYPGEGNHMRLNLEHVAYPAHHPLHPLEAWRVTMSGEGSVSGQSKSAAMRRLVREELNLNRTEFKWLMIQIGGRGDHFTHTWWVFTEDELRSAERAGL